MSVLGYPDPAIEVRPAASFLGFFAALANVATARDVSLAEAESALSEGEASIGRGIESIARLLANNRGATERGEQVPWDYLIERLGYYEAEAARDLTQIRRLVDRILLLARRAEPRSGRRAQTLARRQEDAVIRFIEALRDARWQAMAMRAHVDDASHIGPIFADAAALRGYLANG
jgi:hypothetical protein